MAWNTFFYGVAKQLEATRYWVAKTTSPVVETFQGIVVESGLSSSLKRGLR